MRRIIRSKDKSDVVKALASGKETIFGEMWKLLIFAGMLGYRDGELEKLASPDNNTGIDASTFGKSPAWPGILYLMGLIESEDPAIFSSATDSEDALVERFEQYANRGLTILRDRLEPQDYALGELLEMINSETSEMEPAPNLVREIQI